MLGGWLVPRGEKKVREGWVRWRYTPAREDVVPDKRDKENAVQGEARPPIEELPRVNSEDSARQNEITATLGWPAGEAACS
jgi:hypothetical protein